MAHRRDELLDDLRKINATEKLRDVSGRLEKALTAKGKFKLSTNEISALRLQADIMFRLLAKVVPDVKQMDVNALVQVQQLENKHEIDGALIEAGMDPDEVWRQIN